MKRIISLFLIIMQVSLIGMETKSPKIKIPHLIHQQGYLEQSYPNLKTARRALLYTCLNLKNFSGKLNESQLDEMAGEIALFATLSQQFKLGCGELLQDITYQKNLQRIGKYTSYVVN